MFMAHWLSETSPRYTCEACARATPASVNMTMAKQNTFNPVLFINSPAAIALRQHRKLHVHALMIFTANHGTDHFVRARLGGSGEQKFLRPGLEEQVPPIHPGAVLGSQQGEAMNRTVAIPRFSPVSGHS